MPAEKEKSREEAVLRERKQVDKPMQSAPNGPPPPPPPPPTLKKSRKHSALTWDQILLPILVFFLVFFGTLAMLSYIVSGDFTFGNHPTRLISLVKGFTGWISNSEAVKRAPPSAAPSSTGVPSYSSSSATTQPSLTSSSSQVSPPLQTFEAPDDAHTRYFTLDELREYDGSDPNKPVYLSIKHLVFDVTPGRTHYATGGAYHAFAGRDASRGYITGCFSNPTNHDLRGLTGDQLQSLENWVKFYQEHKTYKYVGKLRVHIDPNSPLPVDTC